VAWAAASWAHAARANGSGGDLGSCDAADGKKPASPTICKYWNRKNCNDGKKKIINRMWVREKKKEDGANAPDGLTQVVVHRASSGTDY
jgi:hypothetical protein